MQLFLFLFLWCPSVLAEDDPDDTSAEDPSAEESAEEPRVRPSGLPIRVPPKGAFAKEAESEPPPPAPEAEEPPPDVPQAEPADTAERVRPTGMPIRVPSSDAFERSGELDESALAVPGLPAYLLPAVRAEQEAMSEPAPEAPIEAEFEVQELEEIEETQETPAPAIPQTDDEFLEELEQELEAEIEAERASKSPDLPQVTVEPEPEPPPPPDPVTWEAYQARRLRFVDNQPQGAFDRTFGWDVKSGAGKHMTAHQFARLVGDTATLDRLQQEETWAARRGYILAGAGGGFLVGAAVSLVNLRNVQSQYQQPLPQEGEFSDYGEYLEALSAAEAANESQHQAAQEDRVWTAVALGAMGAITLTIAPRSKDAAAERQRSPGNYYSRSDADHWMNAYNARIRQDLGLPTFEGAPVKPSIRLEDADIEDDLDTELEELEREESERREREETEQDDASESEPTDNNPTPASPGKRGPELELQIGPGWFGISGRF